ncbi:MAG: flagellar export chaperone FliS [Solirubrobacteraceae bacterium]|jgi:flagellar protein FliS
MSAYAPQSSSAYRANSVLTASSEQLVLALYDGARRFLHQASIAMADGQIAASHFKQKRAEDIIRHLRDTLDMDQGEIADRLYAIYSFSLEHLRKARLEQSSRKLEDVNKLLGTLRDAWATIATP